MLTLLAWCPSSPLLAQEGTEPRAETDAGPGADVDAEGDAEADVPPTLPPSTRPAGPQPIAPAAIGRRIEETFHTLQEVTPDLRRQPDFLAVRRDLPAFNLNLAQINADPALERLETLHPASLHDLERKWSRLEAQLLRWQASLEARSAQLAEEREVVLRERRIWRATLDTDVEHPLPESQRERIEALLLRVRRTKKRLDTRQGEVLELQGELSDQGLRMATSLARIRSAQRNARSRRAEADREPLWGGWSALADDKGSPSITAVASEHEASLSGFIRTEEGPLRWHAIFTLVFLALFVALRSKSAASDLERTRSASAHRALRARPLSAAVLLSAVLAPLAYPYVPVVAVGAGILVMLPALARLAPYLLPGARRPLLVLLTLAGLSVPVRLGFVPEMIKPGVVALIQLASLAVTGWLWAPVWAQPIEKSGAIRRQVYRLIRFSVVLFALALYSNVTGLTERGQLWTAGTLWAITQAVGLLFTTEIFRALIREGLRTPWATRLSYTVRAKRRRMEHLAVAGLRWGAVLAFFYLALLGYDVLDPAMDSLRDAFRRTFAFGSIELSLGSLLIFCLMILGTIAVMRFVHGLLEFELLPRLHLEQGISSAISLTVSYILVALGVVLAFGSAGVGPDRLAMLGGALSVGIGFGLQNVVSNFVSGLILVAERPIQVGDVIEMEALVGEVRRIGIRSSTVRSLDGAEVIVPNADLISGQLINWTLTDAKRRLNLSIGAGYGHPPDEVMRILERVVRTQQGILHEPPPDVLCVGFGDSSIDFNIRAWTGGYLDAVQIKSQLAVRVYAALEREGVEIPFPQRELRIRTLPDSVARRLEGRDGGDDDNDS